MLSKKQIELASSTPMMRQWLEIKSSLSDEIVFCRVGDFYELFFDDAERVTKLLDLQLTKRKIGDSHYPMAGVPVRSLETYVARLVNKGFKVAIIDQLEDAKKAKGMVKRGLTRIITAGTVTEDAMLNPERNNYLSALCVKKLKGKEQYGIAFCDLSTGDFRAGSFNSNERIELLRAYSKYSPVEILYDQNIEDIRSVYRLPFDNDELLTPKPEFWFDPDQAKEVVYTQFDVQSTKGFGIEDHDMAVGAAGAILKYLRETQLTTFPHLSGIKSLDVQDTMVLDATAIRSLELFENTQDHTSYASLFELMDETVTNMGSRLLRHWMANPLAKKATIDDRLKAVATFVDDTLLQHRVRGLLAEIGDIERLTTRISMGTAKPDELNKLASSLRKLPEFKSELLPMKNHFPEGTIDNIDPCVDIVVFIEKAVKDEPASHIGAGEVIREGYNTELDRLRQIIHTGENWLDQYISEQRQKTSIDSLKIKQNNHLGYFIEISKKELSKVPENYIRKQAMVNYTRYFTEELKQWETDILEAEINIIEIEEKLYQNMLSELVSFVKILQTTAYNIAQIDCLSNFAYLSDRRNYVRPEFTDGKSLLIDGARHPVIEALNPDQMYVPNDIHLDYENQRIMIITGPNFSGKSSLLRACATIVIMAHMGSFVPATSMRVGVVDRIFTRIGASDNLVAGQSTFMLEMLDAANLVNNSTDRSLVIADELGRGTSTYDGLAIAWSITEYLHKKAGSPKTLIATHYHQLSELENLLPAVKNYQFVILFEDDKPIFNHQLVEGSSEKSFGVEVAKLSGLPNEVIERGKLILEILESKAADVDPGSIRSRKLSELIMSHDNQTSLDNWFTGLKSKIQSYRPATSSPKPSKIEEILRDVDTESITPLEALALLVKLQEVINNESN